MKTVPDPILLREFTLDPPTTHVPRLRRAGHLREWGGLLVLLLAIYTLVNLLTVRFVVDGASMYPSFSHGEFLLVSRAHYLFGEPQRGDIVVFHYPLNPQEDYIKRLIGLPGEVVELRNTLVFVNGALLNEPYINEPCTPAQCADNRWELGHDEYFLLGDNRNHSSDSRRFAEPVRRRHIVGAVIVRYFPPGADLWVNRIGYPE